jgi:hypothetical protein
MTTIVTRIGKGSALTYVEADDNFTNLNNAKLENVNNLSDVSNTTTAFNNIAPSQSGNSGKYLKTDGTNTSWGTLSTSINGIVKGNGSAFVVATSGTDYAPATSGSSILYGNGSGGFSNVTIGSGLSFSTGTLSSTGSMTYPSAGIANSTGSAWGTSYTTSGSGTVVALTNSPTFTTPALGTPSSGTLTNCTGYTYANLSGTVPTWNQNTTGTADNVTGVVAIANGGTGTTTALAVNVKVFGATGDGTTDDRAAIQSAIDSISSGVVIFPAGDYLIGNNGSGVGLTLKPNVSLISFESASVYLLAGANSIKLLNYVNPNSSTLVSNFVISGINLSSNSKTGCTGINIDGNTTSARCSYIQISEMQLNGTFSNGIYLKYCANTYLSNLFVSLPSVGVTLDNCADSDLVNVKVQNGSSYGFQIIGGAGAFDEGTRLSNCSTNGQGYGLYINGADWGICTGCSFTTAPSGALLTNGTNIHWKFNGCEFAVAGTTPASSGINLSSGCSDFIFIGCVISLNTFGMILKGTSHIVSGCHFEANSNVDLYLDGNTRAVVNGNIFTSTGVSQSVLENSSNYTNAIANINNGTITLSGANSASANNITY